MNAIRAGCFSCGPPLPVARAIPSALLLLALLAGAAAAAEREAADVFDLSIEELGQVQVVSVAGVEQDWFATPAAIYVITGEELRRSGHTSLPEALRMVPGAQVARIDSSQWAIGVRGFRNAFADNLQVLIDGRLVYNELFGGVYWDVQTPLLEDVERIEVIRGPGATLWGANAVNGVINVITKSSAKTRGTYLSAGGGTEERAFAEGRVGAEVAEKVSARVWARYWQRDDTQRPRNTRQLDGKALGSQRPDEWSVLRAGLRLDAEVAPRLDLMLQAEGYTTPQHSQTITVPSVADPLARAVGSTTAEGGHALLRLDHRSDPTAQVSQSWTFKTYYDFENRKNPAGFRSQRDTAELEFRHHLGFELGLHHELFWGALYRYRRTRTEPQLNIDLRPSNRDTDRASAFVQDTLTLLPDELFLMVGSKFEHNTLTGFEAQPSARAWWTPNEHNTLWAAVSRAVRTPNLIEDGIDSTLVFAPGVTSRLVGNASLRPEKLIAYELGYRIRPCETLTLDLAAFYFDYDDLVVIRGPLPIAPMETGLRYGNPGSADSMGVELLAQWRASERLRFEASYAYFEIDARHVGTSSIGRQDPNHQFQIRSHLDLIDDLELDAALYFVDGVPHSRDSGAFEAAQAYFRLDLGLTWRPWEHVELSIRGQNLLEKGHTETNETFTLESSARIERGVYGRVSLRF